MEQRVRVTLHGPALAVLCLAEWMHQHEPEPIDGMPITVRSGGSVEVITETAELWFEFPSCVVYGMIADPPPETATLQRIARDHSEHKFGQQRTATYLLRLELPERGETK
jgi:hypothetical protein